MANPAPRTFIEHLNHEIRSPLTVLVGMTEMLSLSSLTDEQRQCVANMQQALDSVVGMLDSAVDFARLNAGLLSLRREPFHLKDALEEVRRSLTAGERPVADSVKIVVDRELPDRLIGDANRLRQVLGALAVHAVRLRGVRRLVVRASMRSQTAEDVALMFSLGDERLCSAPEVVNGGRPGQYIVCSESAFHGAAGPGLPLTVAAGLAELMDGRIWIGAAPDALVSQFAARFARSGSETPRDVAPVKQSAAGPRSSRRVLLADDVHANRQFLASMLRARGHVVVTADNGRDAVEIFAAQPERRRFDVVILDLEMPVMDGWLAAREVRRLDPAHRTRLAALTAHCVEGVAELIDGDFDAALGKPVSAQRLYDLVESCAEPVREEAGETAAGAGEALADYEGALVRLDGNEQLLDDLARFFLEDSPELLSESRAAFVRRDAKSLERAAHSIRGLASNFGAQRTVCAAKVLEDLGRKSEFAAAEAACQELETEVGRLTAALQRRLQQAAAAERSAR